ncbi:hypothetical protein [Stenomitos frigidus]|uniref:Uncharacterized protein n=1 Tax=Stenomitos frigidus ULC18 TaxID=2107698 RepID=A0A2T1DTU1_9CYAN|nr:hypothetical protein [Stenomitos frigidus]PSB23895.1 hypothetical protein C7B82_29390 [Stenomitos frigidus ULC18]
MTALIGNNAFKVMVPGGADWMTQPDRLQTIKQRAKQGDRVAIAQLINYAVAHKEIAATVAFSANHLEINLEAPVMPDRQIATTLIQRELISLRQATITTVTISGRQTGAEQPAWVQELQLSAEPLSNSPQRSPVGKHPRRKASFTLTFSDVRRFLAQFNPFKAGFIGLLSLYAVFGASNYTVDGFLDGSDRIMMFLHGVNLIFHEAGHTILSGFGQFLHILGGSLMQIMVPAGIAGYFMVTRQPYAGAIALCWMAQSLWDVSIYIKDAQERSLPLLGGEGVLHDWHFLLLDLHLLAQAQLVGSLTFFLGSVLYLIASAGGLYYSRQKL